MAKIDLGLIRGSLWYQGTKITGQNTEGIVFPETGISEAMSGDKYQNSETNDLYECVLGGPADRAKWKWYGNISFGDISDRAVNYELPDAVDMSQVPTSGGMLKNFVGWIFKSIHSLNSVMQVSSAIISKPATTNVFTEFTYFSVKCYKCCNIVTLILNIRGTVKAVDSFTTLFNFPEGYRPADTLTQNFITQDGDKMGLSARASGEFQLYNSNKDIVGWYCRQILTYVVN